MPKPAEIPRFRAKTFKLKKGEVTYYFWDGRSKGVGTIGLGKCRETALKLREQCEQGHLPGGRRLQKVTLAKRRKATWGEWSAAPRWAKRMYGASESRCYATGRPFTLTPAEFLAIVRAADGKCQVSGIPFSFGAGARDPFAPSMDRIDSTKGYVAGNVRLVVTIANFAMNSWGLGPVLRLAEALRAHCGAYDAPIAPVSIAHEWPLESRAEELANSHGRSAHPGAV
jgi:hypothetical protein